MTSKELIGILQALPPDAEVNFSIGDNSKDGENLRQQCAKAELSSKECLSYLSAYKAEIISNIDDDYTGLWAKIYLDQINILNLDAWEEIFDKEYKKTESC